MTTEGDHFTVCVVDDDDAVRTALTRQLSAAGWEVEAFPSAEAFLARWSQDSCGCLVLDVNLPGLDGLSLQRRLGEGGQSIPIVFLTGYGDIPTSVRAMRSGASDFLTKPVAMADLDRAIRAAIAGHLARRQRNTRGESFQQRLARLSAREQEVLAGLAEGKLNKQIAADLGVVEQTVKFHRARIMKRTGAKTLAELMRMVAAVEFYLDGRVDQT